MKKYLTILAFCLIFTASKAQITLENDYPGSATLTELALSGYKYFMMDVANNQCKIYNTDHSIWKTVSLSVPSGMYLYDVRYVSESLFNTDSKVELAYIYYSYDTTLYYYTYYCRVIDENGQELLSIPGCSYVDVRSCGSEGMKLIAYVYDYSIINWTLNTMVYSLPGTLPTNTVENIMPEPSEKPYPNPARYTVNIPYRLPAGTENARIIISNSAGQEVKSYTVDRSFNELRVPKDGLPKGIYFYRVVSASTVLDNGKIIFE